MFASPGPLTVVPEPDPPSWPEGPADGSPLYERYRRAVERLASEDVPFEPLARAIDDAALLAADQRAALWLLAWSLIGPDGDRAPVSSG